MSFRAFLRLAARLPYMPVFAAPEGEETLVGGQAVVEGVMMRAPHSYCVAVRKPNGEIVTEEGKLGKISDKYPIFKLPVFRGVGTLGQAMSLGMKALRFSANATLDDGAAKKSSEISSGMLALNLGVALLFFIVMYKFIPLYIAKTVARFVPALDHFFLINLMDGLIRMVIFVGFLWVISLWKDIHRTFEYHGAEHRVVFNFESGKPVTVENAQSFPTFHPRCGTSFLLVVMLVSMAVYTLWPFTSFWAMFGGRVLLLPLIAGVSYECIRFAAKHRGGLLSTLTAPGLWLQRITTQPPSDDQTEVAIRALDGAMQLEEAQGGKLVIA